MKLDAYLAAAGLLIVLGGCLQEEDCSTAWDNCEDVFPDDERCDGDHYEECNFNYVTGCWEWEFMRDCADDDLVCRELGDGEAACVAPEPP